MTGHGRKAGRLFRFGDFIRAFDSLQWGCRPVGRDPKSSEMMGRTTEWAAGRYLKLTMRVFLRVQELRATFVEQLKRFNLGT
jgi:hypothetical protein